MEEAARKTGDTDSVLVPIFSWYSRSPYHVVGAKVTIIIFFRNLRFCHTYFFPCDVYFTIYAMIYSPVITLGRGRVMLHSTCRLVFRSADI